MNQSKKIIEKDFLQSFEKPSRVRLALLEEEKKGIEYNLKEGNKMFLTLNKIFSVMDEKDKKDYEYTINQANDIKAEMEGYQKVLEPLKRRINNMKIKIFDIERSDKVVSETHEDNRIAQREEPKEEKRFTGKILVDCVKCKKTITRDTAQFIKGKYKCVDCLIRESKNKPKIIYSCSMCSKDLFTKNGFVHNSNGDIVCNKCANAEIQLGLTPQQKGLK